jgi:hypothetical protein
MITIAIRPPTISIKNIALTVKLATVFTLVILTQPSYLSSPNFLHS